MVSGTLGDLWNYVKLFKYSERETLKQVKSEKLKVETDLETMRKFNEFALKGQWGKIPNCRG